MERQLSNSGLANGIITATRLAPSRRGCSPDVLETKDEDPCPNNLLHIFRADPNYQDHMTMLHNKLAQIEIQSQLMEMSLLAQNRAQFTRSAECLRHLSEGIPSRNLLRSAIRASLIPSSTPDSQVAELMEEISADIRCLKTEIG